MSDSPGQRSAGVVHSRLHSTRPVLSLARCHGRTRSKTLPADRTDDRWTTQLTVHMPGTAGANHGRGRMWSLRKRANPVSRDLPATSSKCSMESRQHHPGAGPMQIDRANARVVVDSVCDPGPRSVHARRSSTCKAFSATPPAPLMPGRSPIPPKIFDVLLVLNDYAAATLAGHRRTDMDGYLRNTPDNYRTYSTQRHAHDESEDVRTNPRYRAARMLPVEANAGWEIFMVAHFKSQKSAWSARGCTTTTTCVHRERSMSATSAGICRRRERTSGASRRVDLVIDRLG